MGRPTRKGRLEQEEVIINSNLAIYKDYGFYKSESGCQFERRGTRFLLLEPLSKSAKNSKSRIQAALVVMLVVNDAPSLRWGLIPSHVRLTMLSPIYQCPCQTLNFDYFPTFPVGTSPIGFQVENHSNSDSQSHNRQDPGERLPHLVRSSANSPWHFDISSSL